MGCYTFNSRISKSAWLNVDLLYSLQTEILDKPALKVKVKVGERELRRSDQTSGSKSGLSSPSISCTADFIFSYSVSSLLSTSCDLIVVSKGFSSSGLTIAYSGTFGNGFLLLT